ncbi:MRN complex-interacting protein isoform X2 [Grus americana]|uniref:MRN complex-interacting protein isoform X2 n=1 Tax=Grus americana TaxID=9117 RepID=UPI00240851DC|nr:MRN complex-interacting protein isoform X2 [Grus americana]
MARAGGGMAPRFWVLRCCSCRLFQVQQAKRSGKWSCSVCGQRQAVQKVYGQGSGLDCRHHVQKLNLLQGEAEEAIGRTPWCVEESVTDSKNTAAQREDSSVQQEGRAKISRWSKYLDEDSEDQEDGEEEAVTERQQFCSWRKNTVEEQRKQQKSFLSSDVQEYAEENGVFQLAYQAKKHKKCLVPDRDDGDTVPGDSMVPAVSECVVPEENTQTPTACTKPSKWEKFLSSSDSYSENAARVTLSPQEGSGRLGLHSTTAADAGTVRTPLPQGTGFELKNRVASTEQLAWKLPSTSCSMEDVLFKEPQNQLMRAGCGVSETSARRCSLDSMRRPNALVNCNTGPKPSSVSCEHLFCTDEEFDDDL